VYGSSPNNGKSKKTTRWYEYYKCKNNCTNQSYDSKIVHKELLKELASVKPSKGIIQLFKEILIDEYQQILYEKAQLMENIDVKIKRTENEQLELVEKYVLGKVEEEFYQKLLTKKKQELSKLKAEASKYGDYQEDLTKYVSFGLSILSN